MIRKEKFNMFLQYLLAFLIILESRSVFSRFYEGTSEKIIILLLIFTLILIFLLNFNFKLKKRYLLFLVFYLVYAFLFLLINVNSSKINFIVTFLLLFPLSFLIYCVYGKGQIEDLFKSYVNIMMVISCVSLFFFIFGSLTNMISTNVTKIIDWGGAHIINGYSYLHFNSQTTVIFGKTILRNTSIFVEGPMFALHLMFAMSLSLFFKDKMLNKYSIVFGLTILSTLSVTGFLIYLFLLFYKYTFYNKSKSKIMLLPIVFIVFTIIGTVFLGDKQTTNSYNIRYDDYIAGFLAFEKYPIFGSGFLNNNIVIKYMSNYRLYNTGLSNSFIIVLVQGGLYLILFYLIPIFLNCKKLIFSRDKNLFLIENMILQIYLIFTSTYQYTSLMIIFLAFDYYILLSYNKSKETRMIFSKEDKI